MDRMPQERKSVTSCTSVDLARLVREVVDLGAISGPPVGSGRESMFNPSAETELSTETIDTNVRRIVRWADAKSPFYHRWFKEHGIDAMAIRGRADLGIIPPITKEIMREDQLAHPPFGSMTCTDLVGDFRHVFRTSGTSGQPTMLYWTEHDWPLAVEMLARNLWAAGLRPGMGLVHLWPTGSSQIATIWVRDAAERCGALPVIEGARDFQVDPGQSARFIATLAQGMRIGVITSFHLSESLGREFGRIGVESPVEFLMLGGQPTTRAMREQLKEAHPRAAVYDIWASTEAQTMSECSAGKYHLQEDLVVHNFVDSQMQPAAAGSPAEIVTTSLIQYTQPLIRFAVGDIIMNEINDEPCGCGRRQRTLNQSVVGRTTDLFTVAGRQFLPSAIQTGLDSVRGLTGVFQIVARKDGTDDRLTLLLETHWDTTVGEVIESTLAERLGVKASVTLVEPGGIAMASSVKFSPIKWIA